MNWTYLGIDLVSVAFPLAFSRSERFGFGSRWKFAWLAILGSAIPFLIWDSFFTRWGIWSFSPDYTLGLSLFNLPLEEILFFFCIPFSCLFIYQVFRRTPNLGVSPGPARMIWTLLALGAVVAGFYAGGKTYSLSVLFLFSLFSGLIALLRPAYSGVLLSALAVQYLPFLIINGILTALPIVIYRDSEIFGFRIFSIPIEDAFYSMILLALPVFIYETLIRRFHPDLNSNP